MSASKAEGEGSPLASGMLLRQDKGPDQRVAHLKGVEAFTQQAQEPAPAPVVNVLRGVAPGAQVFQARMLARRHHGSWGTLASR